MAPPPPVDVNVISHHMQRYAVWFGGSMLTSTVRAVLTASHFHFVYCRLCASSIQLSPFCSSSTSFSLTTSSLLFIASLHLLLPSINSIYPQSLPLSIHHHLSPSPPTHLYSLSSIEYVTQRPNTMRRDLVSRDTVLFSVPACKLTLPLEL